MVMIGCFSNLLIRKPTKFKGSSKAVDTKKVNRKDDYRIKPEESINPSDEKGLKEASFGNLEKFESHPKTHPSNVKVAAASDKNKNSVQTEIAVEAAYEGGDEHDGISPMKRDFSDFDLEALAAEKGESNLRDSDREFAGLTTSGKVKELTPDLLIQSGHVSDPGMGRTTSWGTPTLKRSCSNIETKRASRLLCSATKNHSYHDLQKLSDNSGMEGPDGNPGSPLSVMSSRSADKVMLKKSSSSQVLPSRSRKLWWKLFLWSHRNVHRPLSLKLQRMVSTNHTSNQKSGYYSDTIERSQGSDLKMKRAVEQPDLRSRTGLHPEYHWVAFSVESSNLDRVNAWVHSLEDGSIEDAKNNDGEGTIAEAIPYSSNAEVGESSGKGKNTTDEVTQANSLVETMSVFSSVAHISSMGLKVLPTISAYTSLRRVNLSGNLIDHISPGSLPKSLHTLDLSRNKITAIEGLRELTRLRVLNLSYNRISRIGHGLSKCTLIKELYLGGNKISDVEGLHRLPKLIVLDLSFNKIATAKALRQLVANYHSLLALNLVGNPIQSNIGDDQLRKAVSGLLPQLVYLNKQPVKSQRARELTTENVAKAALGDGSWSSRGRKTKSLSHTLSSSFKSRTGEGNSSFKSRTGEGGSSFKSRTGEGGSSFKSRTGEGSSSIKIRIREGRSSFKNRTGEGSSSFKSRLGEGSSSFKNRTGEGNSSFKSRIPEESSSFKSRTGEGSTHKNRENSTESTHSTMKQVPDIRSS